MRISQSECLACLVEAALPAVLMHQAPAALAQARHVVRRGRHALQGLAQRAAQRAKHRAAAAALILRKYLVLSRNVATLEIQTCRNPLRLNTMSCALTWP